MKNTSLPIVVTRDYSGLDISTWKDESYKCDVDVNRQGHVECRVCCFSEDGTLFAYCDAQVGVNVLDVRTNELVMKLDLPRTLQMKISPNNNMITTWENFTTKHENPYGKENLRVFCLKTSELLFSITQKDVETVGLPQWFPGSDECALITGSSVTFYQDKDFKKSSTKPQMLHIEKLSNFQISPNNEGRQHIACFARGIKGGPASVKIFPRGGYKNTDKLTNKSFYKADKATLRWNDRGNAVLAIALQDDGTGTSYYGDQTLHYLSSNDRTAQVQLSKQGPVYDAKWSPDSNCFCVVFGYQPAKAALFNHRCDKIFEFAENPRNEVFFNPHGNLIALCGFGNLRGTVEIWDADKKQQLKDFKATDTTFFQWINDGQHFVTATTAPRLRVDNQFAVWHYLHGKLYEKKYEKYLYQVLPQPTSHKKFPQPESHSDGTYTVKYAKEKAPKAYVPPHQRNNPNYKPQVSLEDDKLKMTKNQKKNRQRKKKKAQQDVDYSQEQKDALYMAGNLLRKDITPPKAPHHQNNSSEKEKKIKKIRKSLQAIEKLKVRKTNGERLEINQLQKIDTEDQLKKELEQIVLG